MPSLPLLPTEDWYNSGMVTYEGLSARALEGKSTRRGQAGLVELALFKKTALAHLLGDWLSATDINPDVKSKLREVCTTFSQFRKHCGWSKADSQQPVNLAWKVGWSRAEDAVLDFIEACVRVPLRPMPPHPPRPTTFTPTLPTQPS